MNEISIRELLYMINGFAKEGVVVFFSNDAVEKLNYLFQKHPTIFIASIVIESYTKLRDGRMFEGWYTIEIDVGYTVLCRLYRNRVFEVWTIS